MGVENIEEPAAVSVDDHIAARLAAPAQAHRRPQATLTFAATRFREALDELRAAVRTAVHEQGLSVAEVAVATALSRAACRRCSMSRRARCRSSGEMSDGTMTYRVHGVLAPMSGFRLIDGHGRVCAAQFNAAPVPRPIDARYDGLTPELSLTEYR